MCGVAHARHEAQGTEAINDFMQMLMLQETKLDIAELPILSVMQGQVPASVSASFGADASFELVWNVTSDASVQSIPLGVTPVPDTLSVSMAGSEVPFSYDEDSNTMIVDGAPVGATLTIRGEPRCVQ